jgi:tripartite-type tricarboxylate transporter receptor subunit TctC
MMFDIFGRAGLVAFVCAILVFLPSHVVGQPSYYDGKRIRFIVGSPVGGGFDAYGRFFARHLPKFVAGNPQVVIQNMPGGAGVTFANFLTHQAPADGTVIGLAPGTVSTAALFGVPGPRYDARRLTWIGSMNTEVGVAVSWHLSKVRKADDLFVDEFVVGGVQATDATVVYPNVLNRVLGTKFKVVPGYHGTSEVALAVERGEVQGIGSWNYSSLQSTRPDWLRDRKVNILLQIALRRHRDLDGIPTVLELAHSERERALLNLVFGQLAMGRPIFGPPGLAPEALTILRSAFDTMMNDPAVIEDASKAGFELNAPMSGDAIARLIAEMHTQDAALVKTAADLIRPN